VTIIRPVKGIEPYLFDCLASVFRQNYPADKITVYICVAHDDPARPIVERVLQLFHNFDARMFTDKDGKDDELRRSKLGPNPKIQNMTTAYREAKGDIMWVLDCNVWVSAGTCGLLVDRLCGFDPTTRGRKYKFVHQLPLSVDATDLQASSQSSNSDLPIGESPSPALDSVFPTGNRLEEMFLSTSHALFYTAISTLAIAPCVVGKSNMFRKSHLDALTSPPGIDHFSYNICEDHLISDLLWKSSVPDNIRAAALLEGQSMITDLQTSIASMAGRGWGNHGLVIAPPCIQPLAGLSPSAYASRRSRWLRVRKFTVPAATAVEPFTESFLANLCLGYGLWYFKMSHNWTCLPTDVSFIAWVWIIAEISWCLLDRAVWAMLQGWEAEGSAGLAGKPPFLGEGGRRAGREPSWVWFQSWLCREILAFPIWAWAIFGGTEVAWRGKKFKVGIDMRVREVSQEGDTGDPSKERRE